jgi:MYXO-CTERM domain-containing protein
MDVGLLHASAIALPLLLGGGPPSAPGGNANGALPPFAMPLNTVVRGAGSHLPAAPGDLLEYHGGAVISNVKVYQVNWGPNVWSQVVSNAPAYFGDITNSVYLDWLSSQYDTVGNVSVIDGHSSTDQHIGRGTFGTSTTITPQFATGNQITNDDISTELSLQLQGGSLPAPDIDGQGYVNALYFVMLPPGVSVQLQNALSCQSFAGYHFTLGYMGKGVPYAVMPDCGQNDWGEAQIIMSHEMIESITDAQVGLGFPAWNSDQNQGQEIGDLCNGMPGQLGNDIVQLMYSNRDMGCVVDSTFRLPICAGQAMPPNCHECSATDNGMPMGCTGATPYCETGAQKPKFGNCVACTNAMQCGGVTPICDTKTDTCRGCTSDKDCKAPTPACATMSGDSHMGTCVQCTADSYCSGTASTPVCDTSSDTCVACNMDSDCQDPTLPSCVNHTCQKCSTCGGGADGGPMGDDGGNGVNGGGSGSPSGCGCSVIGNGSGLGALAIAAGLAFGAAARRRRRRPSR